LFVLVASPTCSCFEPAEALVAAVDALSSVTFSGPTKGAASADVRMAHARSVSLFSAAAPVVPN